jgi:RIO kinase 1
VPNPEDVAFPRRKERFEDRRKEGAQRKLLDEFFDHPTLLAISRLAGQGQFEALDFPIATGKEGGVFRASGAGGYRAVKVYRIGNTVLKRVPAYALEELKREASERNYSRLVMAWTRREHTILRRLTAAGVRVPAPFGYARNVLVMDFIGVGGLPAPRLQDAMIPDPAAFVEDLIEQVRRMTVVAKLVHGDLSPYNVLLLENRPVLIDVAQSVSTDHPQARELFERDIANFTRYLTRLGVDLSLEHFRTVAGVATIGPQVA